MNRPTVGISMIAGAALDVPAVERCFAQWVRSHHRSMHELRAGARLQPVCRLLEQQT
jgi:hypothetical protein